MIYTAGMENKEPSRFQQLRGSHRFRLWVIGGLLVLVAILFIFVEKLRWLLAIAFIALLAAFGLEAGQQDWDLGKMWETGSFQESKVQRDDDGNILFDRFGEMVRIRFCFIKRHVSRLGTIVHLYRLNPGDFFEGRFYH